MPDSWGREGGSAEDEGKAVHGETARNGWIAEDDRKAGDEEQFAMEKGDQQRIKGRLGLGKKLWMRGKLRIKGKLVIQTAEDMVC